MCNDIHISYQVTYQLGNVTFKIKKKPSNSAQLVLLLFFWTFSETF